MERRTRLGNFKLKIRLIPYIFFRFFAAKTKSAILIAVYEGEGAAGADVRGAVEKLAKYLEEVGY